MHVNTEHRSPHVIRQKEGTCLHISICACSSVTQQIGQNRLRIVTPLRRCTLLAVQAIRDPAFNSGGATRSHHKRCLIHGGAARTRRLLIGFLSDASRLQAHLGTAVPFSIQVSRLAPARAVRLAEDSALSAASVLSDCIAASFIAALPFPTASFVDMLSRCYPPARFIVFEQMKG